MIPSTAVASTSDGREKEEDVKSDEHRMDSFVPRSALRIAGVIVPWVLLAVVAFVALGLLGEYRDAASGGRDIVPGNSTEPTSSADGTPSADSTEIPETEPIEASPDAVKQTVVVLVEGLNLREDATTDSTVIKRLALDARLELLGESVGWYHVRDEAGDEGWVAAGGKYTRLE